MKPDLESFFNPHGVAVIGASTNPSKLSHGILKNLTLYGYAGKVYPVNPGATEILNLPCFSDIQKVPDPVDLAVIVLPAAAISDVVRACGERGIHAAIIISGGFQEVGMEGQILQRQVMENAATFGMRIIGPNCVGNININTGLNTTFIKGVPSQGGIGFVSQSGAVCGAVVDYVLRDGIGFSHFISLGNEADVNESDMIEYLADDPHTRVIAAYVESIRDGQRFMQVARSAALKKPLIILKAGRSEAGAQAVSSHTGSLAGSREAYAAAFRQCGAIEVDNLGDLLRVASAFDWLPNLNGNNVALVTNAGGPAALASDSIATYGMKLAVLSDKTQAYLRTQLVPAAQTGNPVDMLGGAAPDEYDAALHVLLKDNGVDACAAILVPQALVDPFGVANAVIKNAKGASKPIFAILVGKESVVTARNELNKHAVPCYDFPEYLGPALGALRQRQNWLVKQVGDKSKKEIVGKDKALKVIKALGNRKVFGEFETRPFLEAYDFPLVTASFASTQAEAVKFAEEVGYPVVLKIVSEDALHKSDIGGIEVGLPDAEAVESAFDQININAHSLNITCSGVLVQPMKSRFIEVILGMKRDEAFGPVLLFGAGGITVELYKDFSNRIAPVNAQEAREMVFETHVGELLNGYRGTPISDIDAVVSAIQKLSQIACDFPKIKELEINPLAVFKEGLGVLALDCRMILS